MSIDLTRLLFAASRKLAITPVLAAALLAWVQPTCAQDAKPMPKEVVVLKADYQKEFGKAKEPYDKVLRAEATKIVSRLVAAANVAGAKQIGEQVDDKVGGRQVPSVDAELVQLFSRYDSAVAVAAKPVRDKYSQRADALLQSPAGKEMNTVIALGELKKVIAGEPAVDGPKTSETPTPANTGISNFARGKKVLADFVEGKTWEFHTNSGMDLFSFAKRGKMRWFRAGGNNPGVSDHMWNADIDAIVVGNNTCQVRFDASGSYGEVVFLSTKNTYRLNPSTQTIPGK